MSVLFTVASEFGLNVSVTTAKRICTCILVDTFHHARNYVQIKYRLFSSGRFAYVAGASQIAKGLREYQINEMQIAFLGKCFC